MARIVGMKGLTKYEGRSESTVLILIRDCGYPAKKILGEWESDTDLIEEWRRDQIGSGGRKKKVPAQIDPVDDFIGSCCSLAEKRKVVVEDLYKGFQGWWPKDVYGPDCKAEDDFNGVMAGKFQQKEIAGKMYYVGVGLKG